MVSLMLLQANRLAMVDLVIHIFNNNSSSNQKQLRHSDNPAHGPLTTKRRKRINNNRMVVTCQISSKINQLHLHNSNPHRQLKDKGLKEVSESRQNRFNSLFAQRFFV